MLLLVDSPFCPACILHQMSICCSTFLVRLGGPPVLDVQWRERESEREQGWAHNFIAMCSRCRENNYCAARLWWNNYNSRAGSRDLLTVSAVVGLLPPHPMVVYLSIDRLNCDTKLRRCGVLAASASGQVVCRQVLKKPSHVWFLDLSRLWGELLWTWIERGIYFSHQC